MVTLVNWLLTVRGSAEVGRGACAWTPSTVSGGDRHRDGEVHSALSRLHLFRSGSFAHLSQNPAARASSTSSPPLTSTARSRCSAFMSC